MNFIEAVHLRVMLNFIPDMIKYNITLTSTVIDRRTRQILKNIPRVAATKSTEYNIISKSIFLRIIIRKFMKIRELFHVKRMQKCQNQHV